MTKLSKAQDGVVDMFYRWQNCRVVDRNGYAVEFWNDNQQPRYKYPNPRTIRTLIQRGILVPTTELNIYELALEWQPRWRVGVKEGEGEK